MSTVTADQKRRVPLPGAQPGDVFDVQKTGSGKYILEKLVRQAGPRPRSASEVLAALEANPLDPRLRWEELRQQTREP
jgi:hypothetical protein